MNCIINRRYHTLISPFIVVLLLVLTPYAGAWEPTPIPNWAKDLIIYQLNMERFTSPNESQGPNYKGIIHEPGQDGSGTTSSLYEKIDYLSNLGITAIWIESLYWYQSFTKTEHPFGFYPYRPDLPHPRHGSEAELKRLVNYAHQKGIKVFMGMVPTYIGRKSPLLTTHPDWFFTHLTKGRPLYNYKNEEFRSWWIKTWKNWAIEIGIDGFRVDGPDFAVQQDPELIMETLHDIATECLKSGKQIAIFVEGWKYGYHFRQKWEQDDNLNRLDMESAEKAIASSSRFDAITVSMHDHHDYKIQGSRFKMGYSVIFGTRIPIFFMGEEFNARLRIVPDPLEAGDRLFEQWLDWSDLEDKDRQAFYQDVVKILNIRKNNKDVLNYDRHKSFLKNLKFSISDTDPAPIPYIRYIPGKAAIIIAGNNSTVEKTFLIDVPLEEIGMGEYGLFKTNNLWTGERKNVRRRDMNKLPVTVSGDNIPRGGIQVLRIEPILSVSE